MKPYSLDFRQKIVEAYVKGDTSIRKVAERFMVSKGFVQKLVKQYRENGSLLPKKATGGQRSCLEGHESEIMSMVAEHPDYTLAEYSECWEEKTGVRLSQSRWCRFLKKHKQTRKKKL